MAEVETSLLIGAPTDLAFDLIDDAGRSSSLTDFRRYYPLIYFGFTSCRVVCPRTLGRLTAVIERLGHRAEWLAPLYISVDPDRDTPAVMRTFLRQHFPRFTGLTGPKDAIDAARASFRVFATRKADPDDPGGYAVPHSAISYLIGPEGDLLAHFSDVLDENAIVERLTAILPERSAPIRNE